MDARPRTSAQLNAPKDSKMSSRVPFAPKILEIANIRSARERDAKPQRPQPEHTKAANQPKRLVKHAKHSSLVDAKNILAEVKNAVNGSRQETRQGREKSKRTPGYVSAASSRMQSPHNSVRKEVAKEGKRWKFAGVQNGPCKSQGMSREARALKIKEMLDRCKLAKGKASIMKDKPLNKLIDNLRVTSPSQAQCAKNPLCSSSTKRKNHKRVLSAVNSPTPDESLNTVKLCTTRVVSPLAEYKKMECKQRKGTKKSGALLRAIRSQPISPENSMYRQQKSFAPVKRLNKIEEAKQDLIKWMAECNLRK